MKTMAKNLLLTAFVCSHAILRILVVKAFGYYEMRFPCGCGRPPFWIISLVKVSDFFSYSFSFGNLIVGDLIWGSIALTAYLLFKKWRALYLRMEPKSQWLTTSWVMGDVCFYLGLVIGPIALAYFPGRWLYNWVEDTLLPWWFYVFGLSFMIALAALLCSWGKRIREYTWHQIKQSEINPDIWPPPPSLPAT